MKNENNRRIETKASGTADIMCLARAALYKDKRECYSGSDDVAYILVPPFFKLLLNSRWLMKPFIRLFYPKGMYEYVIARTKYIDAVFIQALKQGFDQVAILGAGLDSRALRFQGLNQNTTIFEEDLSCNIKVYEQNSRLFNTTIYYVTLWKNGTYLKTL